MALEGTRHNINVNVIVLGIIETEAFGVGNPDMNERMIKRTHLKVQVNQKISPMRLLF